MKKLRFSTEQIVSVLKRAEMGLPAKDLIRQIGITEQKFYRWQRQYGDLELDQVRGLKQLAAELSLDKAVVQDVLSKRFPGPALMKDVVPMSCRHTATASAGPAR